MSEGLESAQMDCMHSNNSLYSKRGQVPICFACNLPSTPLPLTEAHMARSSLKNVKKESMKWPALVFTDSDSLANCQEKTLDKATTRVQNRRVMLREGFRAVENTIAAVVADTLLQVADPLTNTMERDILVFFNSRAFQLVDKKIYRSRTATKCFNVAARRVSTAAHENLTPLFFFV